MNFFHRCTEIDKSKTAQGAPHISVIMPLFNKEEYIKRAIISIVNQTFSDFEVLIINDGSTDKSKHIAQQYIDRRFKIITQKNQGVAEARNTGIKMASAKHIAFLDADDCWHPEFLSTIARLILKFPDLKLIRKN